MAFFKECLSCEGDDSSYFKDPNSEMQAEWTKRNDIIVSIYDGVYLESFYTCLSIKCSERTI